MSHNQPFQSTICDNPATICYSYDDLEFNHIDQLKGSMK